MIKCIISDLDETLLDEQKNISNFINSIDEKSDEIVKKIKGQI